MNSLEFAERLAAHYGEDKDTKKSSEVQQFLQAATNDFTEELFDAVTESFKVYPYRSELKRIFDKASLSKSSTVVAHSINVEKLKSINALIAGYRALNFKSQVYQEMLKFAEAFAKTRKYSAKMLENPEFKKLIELSKRKGWIS